MNFLHFDHQPELSPLPSLVTGHKAAILFSSTAEKVTTFFLCN